ncbi:MAG: hypothetical protein A2Y34_10185 [Spirochaetes bacterium GWC1_27_15]|nr:MAG: hypothetical protein A2Z98_16110 [Spirochaetes bacterium GWB1_27_13]OHD24983.1 MAG: hypothetical protein A2Y34_10185 [Spirochaetes bacterium GWC1_27_15]
MKKFKLIFFLFIIIFGGFIVTLLYLSKTDTQFEYTFSNIFQIWGLATKNADRVITRFIPIDSIDEKDFGIAIKEKFDQEVSKNDPDCVYLNNLAKKLSKFTKKPFNYKIYAVDYGFPNAFALPGGVILITRDLLKTLKTEGQLVAIILHEVGHIELSHCLDSVRFEILTKKIQAATLGEIADFTVRFLLQYNYSKTIESEADEFSYQNLLQTKYDPYSLTDSFKCLKEYDVKENLSTKTTTNVIIDYFSSHPYLELRIEKFEEEAKLWWQYNKDAKKYTGTKNLETRTTFYQKDFGETEWVKFSTKRDKNPTTPNF